MMAVAALVALVFGTVLGIFAGVALERERERERRARIRRRRAAARTWSLRTPSQRFVRVRFTDVHGDTLASVRVRGSVHGWQ